nr:KH domain-containing protein [Buchnera aphidicola]
MWTNKEQNLLNYMEKKNIYYITIINKIDKIKNKTLLLPYIKKIYQKTLNKKIILISATKDKNLNQVIKLIQEKMPKNIYQYPKEKKSIYNIQFLITEIIRETLLNFLNKEIPYNIKIYIPSIIKNLKKEYNIDAIILVPNIRYKKIIIGQKGKKIKRFSIISRKKIENFLYKKTHLKLWVKLSNIQKNI